MKSILTWLFGDPAKKALETIRDFPCENERDRDAAKYIYDELAELDEYLRRAAARGTHRGGQLGSMETRLNTLLNEGDDVSKREAIDKMLGKVEVATARFGADHPITQAAMRVVEEGRRRVGLS
jgi:hypothetical protein